MFREVPIYSLVHSYDWRVEHRNFVRGFGSWLEFLQDIQTNGIKHPITIKNKTLDDKFVVKDGNHRLQAAIELQFSHVPIISA